MGNPGVNGAVPRPTAPAPVPRARHRVLACVAWLALATGGAGEARAQPAMDAAAVRQALLEHLKDPRLALDGQAAYVLTDPALLGAALDEALRWHPVGTPVTPAVLASLKQRAGAALRRQMTQPAGLRALERRVRERFAQPVVTRARLPGRGEVVTVDHGWMPGELVSTGFGIELRGEGEGFENFRPSSRFLAGLLADAANAHPQADQLVG